MHDDPPPNPAAVERQFREIHASTYQDLVRFVERRSAHDEAEDVVSTVFLTAWRRIDDMPEDARPWLFGIARNVMLNQVRGSLRRRDLDVAVALTEPEEAAHAGHPSDSRLDFVRAWQQLDERDRETLSLVAFDGLTADQAAVALGCRRSTFTMRLTRARRRLREALADGSAGADSTTSHNDLEVPSWTRA